MPTSCDGGINFFQRPQQDLDAWIVSTMLMLRCQECAPSTTETLLAGVMKAKAYACRQKVSIADTLLNDISQECWAGIGYPSQGAGRSIHSQDEHL